MKAANRREIFFELKNNQSALQKEELDYFFIKCEYRYEKIHFKDILYIEGMENYIVIWTNGQKYITLLRMKTIEETLPSTRFMRIHKSFIVSTSAISAIDGNELVVGGKKLPISREKKSEIMERVIKN